MSKEIYFYHYSKEKYDELISLSGRGIKDEKYGKNYSDHISFFLGPIPRNIPELLNHKHDFWKKGNKIYEYKIPLSAFDEKTKYRIVETHEKTALIYGSQDWSLVTDDTLDIKEGYLKEIYDVEKKLSYVGDNLKELRVGLKNCKFDLVEDYKNLARLDKEHPEDGLMDKYAACVPHVMMYVGKKHIQYESVREITLGQKNEVAAESSPTNLIKGAFGLTRDREYLDKLIYLKDGQFFCEKKLAIEFPSWYIDKNLADFGEDTSFLGIAVIIVDDKYGVMTIPTICKSKPFITRQIDRDGIKYTRLEFGPNKPFIEEEVVKETLLSYDFFNNYFLRSKVPWFVEYDDLSKITAMLVDYAGSKAGESPLANELNVSYLARDADDPNVFYRQSPMKKKPIFMDFMNVFYSVRNTIDRSTGGYFDNAIVGNLLQPEQEPTAIEKRMKEYI